MSEIVKVIILGLIEALGTAAIRGQLDEYDAAEAAGDAAMRAKLIRLAAKAAR